MINQLYTIIKCATPKWSHEVLETLSNEDLKKVFSKAGKTTIIKTCWMYNHTLTHKLRLCMDQKKENTGIICCEIWRKPECGIPQIRARKIFNEGVHSYSFPDTISNFQSEITPNVVKLFSDQIKRIGKAENTKSLPIHYFDKLPPHCNFKPMKDFFEGHLDLLPTYFRNGIKKQSDQNDRFQFMLKSMTLSGLLDSFCKYET